MKSETDLHLDIEDDNDDDEDDEKMPGCIQVFLRNIKNDKQAIFNIAFLKSNLNENLPVSWVAHHIYYRVQQCSQPIDSACWYVSLTKES